MDVPGASAGNVLAAFDRATKRQRTEGMEWYRNAHGLAASLDPRDPRRAAGVIAALSPRTSWATNVKLAGLAYEQGYASGTLARSCAAATRILHGEDPLDVLSGPKVMAFFANIADPNDARTVCIDRHAIDVAAGERLSDTVRARRYPLSKPDAYERFAELYRYAAGVLGLRPGDVQAVTWVWRRQTSAVAMG